MAKNKKPLFDDDDDMANQWPMIESYTTDDGIKVKVFKAAYAVAAINKYSARPKRIVI